MLGTSKIDPKERALTRLLDSGNVLLEVLNHKMNTLDRQKERSVFDEALKEDLAFVTAKTHEEVKKTDKTTKDLQKDLITLLVTVASVVLDKDLTIESQLRVAAQKQFVGYLLHAVMIHKVGTPQFKEVAGAFGEPTALTGFAAKTMVKKMVIRKILGIGENSVLGSVLDQLADDIHEEYDFFLKLSARKPKVPLEIREAVAKVYVPNDNWLAMNNLPPQLASSEETSQFLLYGFWSGSTGDTESVVAPGMAASSVASSDAEESRAKILGRFLVNTGTGDWNITRLQIAKLLAERDPGSSVWNETKAAIEEELGPMRHFMVLPDQPDSFPYQSSDVSDLATALVSITGRNDVVSSNVVAAESETGGPESSSPALAELEVLEVSDAFTVENFLMNKTIWQLLHSNSKDAAKNGDKIENALAGGYVGPPTTSTQKAGAGLVHVHENFLITKFLGNGGHGAVFEARHKDFLNICLAIKFQCLDKSNLAKFMVRELHLPTKLDKKFAVEMYGWYLLPSGKNKVVMAILMEIGDETLENFRDKQEEMARNGSRQDRIDLLKTNLPTLRDLIEGLEHMNSCGVSHRDFKTESKCYVAGIFCISPFS